MKRNKVISSFVYKFIERFIVKGLGFVIGIILARQISPDDFGQMAILTIFINISMTIVDGGFNSALVQKKEVTEADYSTVFYINFGVSVIAVVLLYFATPFIAAYYKSDLIVKPLHVYSIAILFGALNSIQGAKLQKEMRFKEMFYISIISTVISGSVGVFAAYYGLGLWALVLYYLASTVVGCIVSFIFVRWLPKRVFSIQNAKTLFSFGWKLLVSSILCSIYSDIRSLIIGKKYSTEDLAYYNRGQQFPGIFATTLDSSVQSVMLPVLVEEQDQKSQMRETMEKTVMLSSFLVFPAMIGLCVIAEPLIILLLTEKWISSIPFMRVFCIAQMTIPLASSNLVALKASGRSDLYMKLEAVRRIVMACVLLITVFCFDSVMAITIGVLISSFIDVVIITVPIKKILDYGFISQIKGLWKIGLSSVLMGGVVYAFSLVQMNTILKLLLSIAIGIVTYFVFCLILKEKILGYAVSIVKSWLKKGKTSD